LLIVRWLLQEPGGETNLSCMSLVLENGDVHHFYSLAGSIHHSYNRELRGRYEHALSRELARPGAEIVYQWGVTA
jgi:hypothetical protein